MVPVKSPGKKPDPTILEATDAVVKNLQNNHLWKRSVYPAVTDGRILGHEGVGVIGTAVTGFKKGLLSAHYLQEYFQHLIFGRSF